MDSGMYAAYTGLLARTQALDTAANNLSNAGTSGFRAQRDYFRGVLAGGIDESPMTASQVGQAVNGFGVLGGDRLDFGQGQLETTGNPLDMALQGSGFFAIQTTNGVRYTRDGSFTRSSMGVLETSIGEPVLDANMQPITVPTGSIHVSADGTISVSTSGGSAIAGQVGIFDFSDENVLTAEGTNTFNANGVKPIAGAATVQQGALENSNEDTIHGTMQMVLVQRQFEMMRRALSVFNNDFDKTATEDLPRV
ncbi:flagellar basal-body rod protein FlgF [Edaphobacter acidisoli]|uniref:Flagellar basal-body rod protein FlgF n=1 Tax=Edaphobacter acidisoli TaxID=2040573 RepID=A0A916RJJ8_9BACT|nr:flagellar hook basal-body protein [Edaphobacter acidisoli]GGA56110.1 flagellar basal-body rod protein FlgF [Edaphobacter acidisoli]